jgi:hypothetical protein
MPGGGVEAVVSGACASAGTASFVGSGRSTGFGAPAGRAVLGRSAASVIMPRFLTRFPLKPCGANLAAALMGSSRMRKVSTLPEASLESECPHSAEEQQVASAGKSRKAIAMTPMTMPASSTPMRNSGASRSFTRPLMKMLMRMALQVASVTQGSQREKRAFMAWEG